MLMSMMFDVDDDSNNDDGNMISMKLNCTKYRCVPFLNNYHHHHHHNNNNH